MRILGYSDDARFAPLRHRRSRADKIREYCRAAALGASIKGSARTQANQKERGMEIEFIRKTRNSSSGNCPAIYRAPNGNYVIQGWLIDDDTRARLRDLADNETAIEVPADVIAGIVEAA